MNPGESVIKVRFLGDSLSRIAVILLGQRSYRVAVYDFSTHSLVADSPCDATEIKDLAIRKENEFVTVGVDHICFWTLESKTLLATPGLTNKSESEQINTVEYAFAKKICFTGSKQGILTTWIDQNAVKPFMAHNSEITVLFAHDSYLYSGCRGGVVII